MKASRTRQEEIRMELAFLAQQNAATGYHPQELAFMRQTCLAELQRLESGSPKPALRRIHTRPTLAA